MIYYHNDQVIRQRLATREVLQDGIEIEIYDSDNLYPQRMKQIRLASPLVVSATKVLTDFINGDGFENGDTVVNSDGQTINDILDLTTVDTGQFKNSMALMIDFNALGQVVEIQYLPFEFVRFGKANASTGRHKDVKVSNNWEMDRLRAEDVGNIKTYPLFNPLTASDSVVKGTGGTQVLYITSLPDEYSLATFDAVADAAQTDAELQTFELNTVSKGFAGVTLFKVPGGWEEGTKEEKDLRTKAEAMSGARGGGIITVGVDDGGEGDQTLLETVPAENKDRLFDLTTIHVRDIIGQNYNQPAPLSGISPSGSVFSQAAYKDAFLQYNAGTKNERNRVERAFQKLMDLWHEGPVDLGKITPQVFEGEEVEEEAPVIPLVPEQSAEETEKDTELKATYGTAIG